MDLISDYLSFASFLTVEHCPRLLEAAQTLYHIATHPSRHNSDGMIKWPKKPSQKAMKARKLKCNEKTEELCATTSVFGSDNPARRVDQIMPSKKPKLSHIDNKKDLSHFNCGRKEAVNWSTPRSSRSSPNKSIRDSSMADTRHSTANYLNQSCMMPPPVRDKASNSQQKLRKLMPTEWKRGRDRLD